MKSVATPSGVVQKAKDLFFQSLVWVMVAGFIAGLIFWLFGIGGPENGYG